MSTAPPNVVERLRFHADRVEECGHLNAARYMRIAADDLDALEAARVSTPTDDGQPDEIQEWNDYDRDC